MAGMVLQSPLASGVRTACPGCCAEALLSRIDVFVNIDKVVRTHCLSNTSRKQMLERQGLPSRDTWSWSSCRSCVRTLLPDRFC